MKKEPIADWEKEFDDRFPFAIIDWINGKENDGDGTTKDKMIEIKSYIRSLLASNTKQVEERVRKECADMVKNMKVTTMEERMNPNPSDGFVNWVYESQAEKLKDYEDMEHNRTCDDIASRIINSK